MSFLELQIYNKVSEVPNISKKTDKNYAKTGVRSRHDEPLRPLQTENDLHANRQQGPFKQSTTPTQAVDKVQANGEQGQRIINGQALALLMRLHLHY